MLDFRASSVQAKATDDPLAELTNGFITCHGDP